MPQRNPFTVTLYSKAFGYLQGLGSALSYSFTPRFTLGIGELVTKVDDPANQLLSQDGVRVVVQYRGEAISYFVDLETGPVTRGGTITWALLDDRTLLTFVRAWIRPAGNLTATSLSDLAQQVASGTHQDGRADGLGYYAWPATPAVYSAETAVKRAIADNLARFTSAVWQGRITIAADQQRGGDARAANTLPQLRMETLQDGLAPLLDWSGLLLRVWQPYTAKAATSPGLQLDVVAPVTWAQTIGARSGIVRDGSYQRSRPAATRVILGAQGDDAERLYYQVVDSTGLEARFGYAVETFAEATGATLKWPDGLADAARVAAYYLNRTDVADADKTVLTTYLQQTGATVLREGRPTSGLDINLSETASFHYGGADGYHIGDIVTATTGSGLTIAQRITEATLTYSADGFSVAPKLGAITEDPTAQLANAVRDIAQGLARMSTRH